MDRNGPHVVQVIAVVVIGIQEISFRCYDQGGCDNLSNTDAHDSRWSGLISRLKSSEVTRSRLRNATASVLTPIAPMKSRC